MTWSQDLPMPESRTSGQSHCGGCRQGPVRVACEGSLRRHDIKKAHWECWSECNLPCAFCFRTTGAPLDTERAVSLLRALSAGKIRAVVFAGGDPSLRGDLAEVVAEAISLGLAVQVQTNGQHVTHSFLRVLARCEYVGLSIDGPDEDTHDNFRGKRGNFRHVMALLRQLDVLGVPVSVRTVVSRENYRVIPRIAQLILEHPNVICWKLLEFTAIGKGRVNQDRYAMPTALFEHALQVTEDALGGDRGLLEALRNVDKIGIYMMISPQGFVYGTTEAALMQAGHHHYIGSILSDHLEDLARWIPFSSGRPDRRTPSDIQFQGTGHPRYGKPLD
jgi:MoaA/NifB/PqqE/SkfB family radical SAM enzyme